MRRLSSPGTGPGAGVAAVPVIASCISVALARDHEGLVEEPEAGVSSEHFLRRLEIASVAHDFGKTLVLDLSDIHRGIPGREQGRRADRVAYFFRKRVHLVAENRSIVGVGVEVEVAAVVAQLV